MGSILRLSQSFKFTQEFSHSISGAQFSGRMLSAKGILHAFLPQKTTTKEKKQVVKWREKGNVEQNKTKEWKTGGWSESACEQDSKSMVKTKGKMPFFLSEIYYELIGLIQEGNKSDCMLKGWISDQ